MVFKPQNTPLSSDRAVLHVKPFIQACFASPIIISTMCAARCTIKETSKLLKNTSVCNGAKINEFSCPNVSE